MDMYRMFINRDLPWAERSCGSKVPYETRREALAVARDPRRTDGALRPYHCRLGDHWHLGHRRRPATSAAGVAHGRDERRGTVEALDWLDLEWWEATTLGHLRFPPGSRLTATGEVRSGPRPVDHGLSRTSTPSQPMPNRAFHVPWLSVAGS